MSDRRGATVPASDADSPQPSAAPPTLREATRIWLKIGLLSFGGPAGQIALMHRILVEEKRWIREGRFLHALNFCMLLPGPEAQQLATYVGWSLHGMRGGLVAGCLFVLPGFCVILALSYLYVAAGNAMVVQGLFIGLKAAVVVIVLQAVIRIGRRSLRGVLPAAIAVLAFLAMFAVRVPFPWVIAAAALAGAVGVRYLPAFGHGDDPSDADAVAPQATGRAAVATVASFAGLWLLPVALLVALAGEAGVFTDIGVFFSKMAVVTFGGAYAVLAYVSQEAVGTYQWLTPGEMIDGLAMAETTPGPLIMVTQFVGFLAAYRDAGALPAGVAGLLGSLLTVWVTFVPCFLWIFAAAPFLEQLRRSQRLSGALSGVMAAVVGVIVNLALWFSLHALFAEVVARDWGYVSLQLPVLATLQLAPAAIVLVALLLVFGLRSSVVTTLVVCGALGVASVWI